MSWHEHMTKANGPAGEVALRGRNIAARRHHASLASKDVKSGASNEPSTDSTNQPFRTVKAGRHRVSRPAHENDPENE
jgi:hypothetical protein